MNQVRDQLERDHRELEQLLRRLAQDAAAPSSGVLQTTWNELEGRLLAHMDAEEHYLLPLVEVSHPLQAEQTRVEHARLRHLVSELGVAVELHAVREAQILELVLLLREHAEREDRSLYCYAGEKASAAVQHRISTMLKAALRASLATLSRVRLAPTAASSKRPPANLAKAQEPR